MRPVRAEPRDPEHTDADGNSAQEVTSRLHDPAFYIRPRGSLAAGREEERMPQATDSIPLGQGLVPDNAVAGTPCDHARHRAVAPVEAAVRSDEQPVAVRLQH